MFDLAYAHGTKLSIRNRRGLVALTLAARLAKDDVRNFEILFIKQQVYLP